MSDRELIKPLTAGVGSGTCATCKHYMNPPRHQAWCDHDDLCAPENYFAPPGPVVLCMNAPPREKETDPPMRYLEEQQ